MLGLSTSSILDFTYYRGRVGLFAILRALGVGPGDRVAMQAFTCLALPEALYAAGARPVWIDTEPGGVNMDPESLADRLDAGVKAVVVQHTYGVPADMARLTEVVEDAGIPLIEDCAHTVASALNGRTLGTLGVAAFYSFEWGKPIRVGVGGSVRANDDELRQKLTLSYGQFEPPPRRRRAQLAAQYVGFKALYRPRVYWPIKRLYHQLGRVGLAARTYNPVEEGAPGAPEFNRRMAAHQVGMIRRRLERMPERVARTRAISAVYEAGVPASFGRPTVPDGSDVIYARYPLWSDRKDELLAAAQEAQVEVSGWYATPLHPFEGEDLRSVGYEPGSCPNTEQACRRIVTLPNHPSVSVGEAERISGFLREFPT